MDVSPLETAFSNSSLSGKKSTFSTRVWCNRIDPEFINTGIHESPKGNHGTGLASHWQRARQHTMRPWCSMRLTKDVGPVRPLPT